MLFYLITLNLEKILNKRYNKFIIKTSDVTIVIAINIWKFSDFKCKNYIFDSFENISYDLYKSIDSSRTISKSLDWKYKDKDDNLKKIIVNKFLNFEMVDSIIMTSQVQDF